MILVPICVVGASGLVGPLALGPRPWGPWPLWPMGLEAHGPLDPCVHPWLQANHHLQNRVTEVREKNVKVWLDFAQIVAQRAACISRLGRT